jgi:hypothetical protein
MMLVLQTGAGLRLRQRIGIMMPYPPSDTALAHFDKNCKDWDGREAENLNSTSVGLRVAKTRPQYAPAAKVPLIVGH